MVNTNGELWTWAGFPDFGTFLSPVSTTIDFVASDEFGNPLFSAQLTPSEIIDPNSLVPRLTNHTDLLSEFLWNQMPFHQDFLVDTNMPPDQKVAVLADGLNVSLQGPSIYEEQRFVGITLSAEVQALIQSNPQGQDLIRLNRLLLEAAYPAEIAPLTKRPWRQIGAGVEHWLGIRNDGSLWGEGLGLPRGRIDTASDWIHAAAGNNASAAIKADGTLWTWGEYTLGLLGNPALFAPRPVPLP